MSAALALYSTVRYIQEMVQKGRKPHRITRLALCIVMLLSFFSTRAAHGNLLAQLLVGSYAACSVLALGLCLPKGKGIGGTSKADIICLAIALIGIMGWQLSGSVKVGQLCSIAADIAAFVPTIVATCKEPSNEGHWSYTISAGAAVLSLLAYPFTTGSWFTAYLVFIDSVMVVCINLPVLQEFRAKAQLRFAEIRARF